MYAHKYLYIFYTYIILVKFIYIYIYKSSKVVAKLEIDFNKELLNRHPSDYKEKHIHLSKKPKGYEKELEKQ